MGLTALMSAVGMQADDYLYSHTAKYRIMSENLVSNGDFSESLDGWHDEAGSDVDSEIWAVESQCGPNDEPAVVSQSINERAGNALVGTWAVEPGTYVISFYAKSETTVNTTTTAGQQNYLDIFLNATATPAKTADDVQVATATTITDEWTQTVFPITVTESQYIIFFAQRLATGTMLTNIALHRAEEVYDTRKARRYVDFVERLLQEEELPNGRDEVTDALEGMVKPAIEADADDLEMLMEMFRIEIVTPFLDANGTSLIGTVLNDWADWGGLNYNSMTTRDGWTFEGGRWGFFPNDAFAVSNGTTTLEFTPGDGYIASAGIQTGYTLDVGLRSRAGYLDDFGPGKYLFAIEAQAVAAANKANPYGADHAVAIVGPTIFVGEDSTVLENDTISGYYWKTYYKIAEIKEGQELKVGFRFPVVDGKKGGRYSLRNPQVRQLGITPEQAQFNRQKNAFIIQQYNLGLRLANYPEELKDYPWEQNVLTAALEQARPVYEASLLIIDANGNVLQADMVTEEQTQLLLEEVNNLGRARNAILTANAPIRTLKDAVEAGRTSLSNPANAGAAQTRRNALQDAVNAGQALLDAISSVNEGEAFTAAAEAILAAKEAFEATTATRSNPTEIQIKNGDFSDFAAGNNVTSVGATKDWNWTMGASTSRWEIRDNETLEQGHGASIWRGTTVGLDGKCQQTIELPYEGLYEYRAKAYISEERLNELVATAKLIYDNEDVVVDTVYAPNIRLFFGLDGRPDSITVSKCYLGVKDDGTYFTREVSGTKYPGQVYATYSVFFTKTGNDATTAEFGLEAADNAAAAGANGFGFGMNQIFYLGDEAQYLTDTKAAMNELVARVSGHIANIDNYWAVKARRYISAAETAQTAKEMQNIIHSLTEVAARAGVPGDTEGIFDAETVANPASSRYDNGLYDLQGRKLPDGQLSNRKWSDSQISDGQLSNRKWSDSQISDGQLSNRKWSNRQIKKGFYIFNGRKLVVK